MKKVLSIAGSDCSGGAGIQADLKTFSAHGVFGMSVIVSVVAENTSRVIGLQDVTPDIIGKQIDAVFEDIEVDAVKIGMLSTPDCMKAVAEKLRQYSPRRHSDSQYPRSRKNRRSVNFFYRRYGDCRKKNSCNGVQSDCY